MLPSKKCIKHLDVTFEKMDFFEAPDPLLCVLFKLRVMPRVEDHEFKLNALDALRASKIYKQLKLKQEAIDALERNLVQAHLSPLAFTALCALYDVAIVVAYKTWHYVCGDARFALRGTRIGRIGDLSDSLEITPSRPLYAASHYTLSELQAMALKLRVSHAKVLKADLYLRVKTEIARVTNV